MSETVKHGSFEVDIISTIDLKHGFVYESRR